MKSADKLSDTFVLSDSFVELSDAEAQQINAGTPIFIGHPVPAISNKPTEIFDNNPVNYFVHSNLGRGNGLF